MELGPQVLECITLAGDAAHVPDKSFAKLVTCACQGVLNEEHRNIVEENPAFKDINKAVLKAAFSGLVTLIIEAAKHDSSEQNISSLLEDCKYTADKINEFCKLFLPQKPHIQLLLGKIGSSFPHIVDVDWRLDYCLKNNNIEKVNSGVYLISLKTEVPGEQELKDFQFSCTVEQLQSYSRRLDVRYVTPGSRGYTIFLFCKSASSWGGEDLRLRHLALAHADQDLVGKLRDATKCMEKIAQV